MKLFRYYEIRACVRTADGDVQSFLGNPVFDLLNGNHVHTPEGAQVAAAAAGTGHVFWTIYGIDQNGEAEALIDRTSFQAALDTLHAMLVPLRHAIDGDEPVSDIEDILNQSSNEVRL